MFKLLDSKKYLFFRKSGNTWRIWVKFPSEIEKLKHLKFFFFKTKPIFAIVNVSTKQK